MGRIWERLLKVLGSTRTALWLMISVGVSTVYGVTVSQAVFASAWFRVLGGFLFLNTASCTAGQVVRSWRFWRTVGKCACERAVFQEKNAFIVSDAIDFKQAQATVKNFLRLRGYRMTHEPLSQRAQSHDIILCGYRGRLGYWGSPLFHSALLLIMIGAMLSSFGRTTEDIVLNEEGQTVLQSGVFSLGAPETVTLNGVKLDFNPQGQMTEWTAQVSVARGESVREQAITSEREYEDGFLTMWIQANGYTPGLVVRQNGQEVARIRLLLRSVPLKDGYRYEGEYQLPGKDPEHQVLNIRFWPDFVWKGQEPGSTGDAPLHPALELALAGRNPQDKVQVIGVGENTQIGSWNITFDHYKPWLMLRTVRDPGYLFMVSGFWLAAAGLMLLFLWIPREIFIKIAVTGNETALDIAGKSYRFRWGMQSEIEAIAKGLQDALTA